MSRIIAADLFAGAGGASVGLRRACAALGLDFDLVAVNHWPTAVETHRINHPRSMHLCEAVERVRPRDAVPGGRLHLLLAGPSCVHHSRARGGRPVNEQDRASAWCILRWVDELRVDTLLIENVREFEEWGPVAANGRPLKSRKGAEFRAWVNALEAANYRVEWNVLNAANYGDATTRERLWIIARRNRARITWPEPTHNEDGLVHLFGARKPWVPARDIIDWSIPGKSIFERKKPLAPKTIERIAEGFRRFGGAAAEPLIMLLTHGGRTRPITDPLWTVTGAHRGEVALVEPFILQQQSGGAPRAVGEPLATIAGRGAQALVCAFAVPFYGERAGQVPRTHSVEAPLPVIPASAKFALITSYYSKGGISPVSAPLPTATARDRFGLAVPVVDGHRLDIRFRMLQPHELAAAMSFDPAYQFAGNRGDQVRQIGNAWPCRTAEALVREVLAEHAVTRVPARARGAAGR